MRPPYVVGLDPSLTGTGLALPPGQPLDVERLRTITSVRTGGTLVDRRRRYAGIVARVLSTLEDHPAFVATELLVAVEGYAFASNGRGHADIIELGWMLRDRLTGRYGPDAVVEVSPSGLKKYATGSGSSKVSKADMRVALLKRTGIDERDENRVDAEWLRLMALDALGAPVVELPAAHRQALDAVAWPTRKAA